MKSKKGPKFIIGLDAHKAFTQCAVRDQNGNLILNQPCATTANDVKSLIEPFSFSCIIGIECNTESYPIYDGLKNEFNIKVANTIQLRTLVGKNDSLDAQRLADMLRLGTFPCSFIPEEHISTLRSIVKVRHSILKECTRLQHQIKAFARKNGIRLVHREGISKANLTILQKYLADHSTTSLRFLLDQYTFTAQKLEQVTNEMAGLAQSRFPKEYASISLIRGIGDILTSYFISEICPISRFKSEKKLRRYAGIIPCSEQSGGKTYATYLPKNTSRGLLRWALVEAANCTSKHNDELKAYYQKKKREKKIHGKAIMAVARSVSDKIYKSLSHLPQATL